MKICRPIIRICARGITLGGTPIPSLSTICIRRGRGWPEDPALAGRAKSWSDGSDLSEQAEMEQLTAATRRHVIVHNGLAQPVARAKTLREKGRGLAERKGREKG